MAKPTKFKVLFDALCTEQNLQQFAESDTEVEQISSITDLQTLTLRLCYLSMDILRSG